MENCTTFFGVWNAWIITYCTPTPPTSWRLVTAVSRRKCGRTFTVLEAQLSLTETWNSFGEVSVMWQHFKLHCLVKCNSSGFLFRQRKDCKSISEKYASILQMAYTAVLVYVTVCFNIPLFYFKVMVRMKWGIYDTFADENLCRRQNYIEWNITVFCVDECRTTFPTVK